MKNLQFHNKLIRNGLKIFIEFWSDTGIAGIVLTCRIVAKSSQASPSPHPFPHSRPDKSCDSQPLVRYISSSACQFTYLIAV